MKNFEIINPMKLHLMLNPGGMGDILHCIPAVKAAITQYPYQKYRLWVPDYLMPLFQHIFKKDKIEVGPFSKAPKKADGKETGIIGFNIGRHSSMRIHLTDYAFYMILDRLPVSEKEKKLPTVRKKVSTPRLPSKYAVLGPFWRVNLRQAPDYTWDEIERYLHERGVIPVILGSKQEKFNDQLKTSATTTWTPKNKNTIDLSNQTTVLQALEIIWGSKAVVCMDGGLFHLACMTKTPVIAGFTSVDPITRIPYGSKPQVKAIVPGLFCDFCQTKTCMVYDGQFEFNKCWRNNRECVSKMTPDKFISGLEEAL